MASKNSKKHQPNHRIASALKEATSIGVTDGKKKEPRFVIWPEWSDADINAEKWDAAQKGRDKEKGKSPVSQQNFEDPEGKIQLPPNIRVSHWKRPQDFITEKTPTIIDPEGTTKFDLMAANEDCHESELMRWITCQIGALWHTCTVKLPPEGVEAGIPCDQDHAYMWRPWEHIYAINKINPKGLNVPAYNPFGKYAVKLYWMGCWRKVIIDDTIPFDDEDRLLLPATALQHELWPLLLSKALIKVAALDYSGGGSSCEFGDFSVISCLTGWLPEAIPLQYGHEAEIWNLLKSTLVEWKLPEPESAKTADEAAQEAQEKEETAGKEATKTDKADGKKEKGKDKKDDKRDKKDKKGDDKTTSKAKGNKGAAKHGPQDQNDDGQGGTGGGQDELQIPDHPEMVVFASFSAPPRFPVRVSALGEMADASEKMRQMGISHMFPHPVRITQTRSCPLEPPPPPEVTPAWKLIRPRIKKTTPCSDEPTEVVVEEKPIQCLEITSPFINYKVNPVPIPSETHRPKSSLSRGGARTPVAGVNVIQETEENGQTPPAVEEAAPPEQKPAPKAKAEPAPEVLGTDRLGTKKVQGVSPSKRPEDKVEVSDKKPAKERKISSVVKDSKAAVESKSKGGAQESQIPAVCDVADPEECETDLISKQETQEAASAEKLWMDYDVFTKCFKTLYIYHKPNTYLCNQRYSALKTQAPGKERRSAPPSTAASSAAATGKEGSTPRGLQAPTPAVEDRFSHFLYVDQLKPTEIVVSFSAVSKWNEAPIPAPPPRSDSRGKKDRESKMGDAQPADSNKPGDAPEKETLQPGLLVAEPHSWKSLVTGQPLLRLRTTATRAAVLSLPAGRHVLRLHMQAPLGYHVHMVSSVSFVFGDEERVMAELVKDSCRFVDNANQIVTSLGKCISSFHDEASFSEALEEYTSAHCPYRSDESMSLKHHFRVYNEAFYRGLRKTLGDAQLLTPEMSFAWRVFNFDCTTLNPLGLRSGQSRPGTSVLPSDRGSTSASKRTKDQKCKPAKTEVAIVETINTEPQENKQLEAWLNREITPDEHVAAIKIQKVWRGFFVRKVRLAQSHGSEINLKVQEQLLKAWQVIEANKEAHGTLLLRSLFKADPALMPHYPFHQDEWNRISYSDYAGTHPEQPANTWFIVFRDIFHVAEEMLCVPKLYAPIQTCVLRVVNNDTGEEIPRVFQKVAPYVYKRNKRGYTFVAEARTVDTPLAAGRWKMRLIGALNPLPASARNEMNAAFHTREIRDYYIPNEKKTIFRFIVKAQEDHLVSLQLATSKSDVYVKLEVLNHEEEVISAVGKGHVVLPAFIFRKNAASVEKTLKRPSSVMSRKGLSDGSSSNVHREKKQRESAGSQRSGNQSVFSDEAVEEREEPDKYIVQAQVLRNSWPLSEAHWAFVQMLKDIEKHDLHVSNNNGSPVKEERSPVRPKEKVAKGKASKAEKGSRPASVQFDVDKPHWTLRIVSDGSAANDIEVRKDTERADAIRAMKKAWEDAQPGRAAKALQSRLNYLKANMVKVETEVDAEAAAEAGDGAVSPAPAEAPLELDSEVLLAEPPPPPPPKEILQPLDITPFVHQTTDSPRLKDAEEIERQDQAKKAEIAAYRAHREQVEAWREQDRIARNKAKVQQLEMCERMQAAVDAGRDSINGPREAFRQKFLEAERQRLEELAAQEAALQAAQDKPTSPKGRRSAKGRKSPGKKKK